MLGARYVGRVFCDGKEFTNNAIHGDSDNNKRQLVKRLMVEVHEYMVPRWIAEHKLEIHITDRKTGETIVI